MDAELFVVLITAYLADRTLEKGERFTLAELGPHAFTVLQLAIAIPLQESVQRAA